MQPIYTEAAAEKVSGTFFRTKICQHLADIFCSNNLFCFCVVIFMCHFPLFVCLSTTACEVLEQLLYDTCTTYYSTIKYIFYLSSVLHYKACVLLIN